MRDGNPTMGNKMQLFSKTNYFFAIFPNGSIEGTQDRDDPHSIYLLQIINTIFSNVWVILAYLEIISAGFPGGVKIRGIETGLFVTMSEEGIVYGQVRIANTIVCCYNYWLFCYSLLLKEMMLCF